MIGLTQWFDADEKDETMRDDAAAHTRFFRVGKFTVTVTLPLTAKPGFQYITVEWQPECNRRLNKKELREYRSGITEALLSLQQASGIKIVSMDDVFSHG